MHKNNPHQVTPVVRENIQRLLDIRWRNERQVGPGVRVSDWVTSWLGSVPFLAVHFALVVLWLIFNSRTTFGIRPWDPYPFVMLAMIASVEAIFLSTFVLISQNRQSQIADRRAELALQIGLLTEHEVTRLIQMLDRLLEAHDIPRDWPDLEELKSEVIPEQVMSEIERKLF